MTVKPYNLSVLGVGSVGVVSLLHLLRHFLRSGSLELPYIMVIHDPSIPTIEVGEATTWCLPSLLHEVLGEVEAYKVLEACKYTNRNGVEFIWEDTPERDFLIEYESPGVHFDSGALHGVVLPAVLSKFPRVSILEERVVSVNNRVVNGEYTFDLIFDCRGTPSPSKLKYSGDYVLAGFESVNSVLLYQDGDAPPNKEGKVYSTNTFHNNGWMFKIPLQHRSAYGYLYNNNITGKWDAMSDFKRLVPLVDLNEVRQITWQPYYRTHLIREGVAYLGNKLYFLEPAQAIPIHFYLDLLEKTLDAMLYSIHNPNYKYIECNINDIYTDEMDQVCTLIGFNYTGDMGIHSNFWSTVPKEAKKFMTHSSAYSNALKGGGQYPTLWCHNEDLMKQYILGFGIKIEDIQ
jgi:hypothetical protein